MIYTCGHRQNYLDAIAQSKQGVIQKTGRRLPGDEHFTHGYDGGCAFQSIDDAQRYINEQGDPETWTVFGLDADWNADTTPGADGWWHYLLHDADIVVLGE